MKNLITILFLLAGLIGYSQSTQTIRGTVYDKQLQYELPGANVIVVDMPQFAASTDINGEFEILNVPIGRHTIQISFMGYETQTLNNIILDAGKELNLTVNLVESYEKLDEVEITVEEDKKKPQNETALISARTFSIEETSRYAGSLNDPARMAQNYAGVMGSGDQRNDIIIRGNSPMGLLWKLEGIAVPNPNHFGSLGTTGGPISMINNNQLNTSDFMTGAFPAEYGNALGGAFDLKLRSGNHDKREHLVQMGFNGLEVGTEGPFKEGGRASYLANYRYSTLGVFDAMGIRFGVNAVPQYQDLSFKIDIPTGLKFGRFGIFGLGGLSYIEMLDSDKSEDDWTFTDDRSDLYFGSNSGVVGLTHLIHLGDKTNLRTVAASSGSENLIRSEAILPNDEKQLDYSNRSSQVKHAISSQLNHKINTRNFLRFGMVYEHHVINFSDSVLLDNGYWLKNYNIKENFGLGQSFVNYQYRINENLTLNTGVFAQYLMMNQTSSVEPRASVQYSLTKKQNLTFGYGLHSQTQPSQIYFAETLVDTVNQEYVFSNKDLKMSKSNHFVLGYTNNIGANVQLKMEAYYQYLYDIPVQQRNGYYSVINAGADFGIPLVDSLVNNGTGENYGIELTFEKFYSKNYYFLLTGSLFESTYIASDGIKRNTAFNGNYSLTGLAGYEFNIGKNGILGLSVKSILQGGKRYVEIDVEASNAAGRTIYNMDEIFTNKHKDYFRFDSKISFKMNGKKVTQEWAFDVQNVFNTKNIFQQIYSPERQGLKTEYQLGFFPVGQYRLTF